jgi:hypothetical protein
MEPYLNRSLRNVDLLVNFLLSFENYFLWMVKTRFKGLKDLEHELLIVVV